MHMRRSMVAAAAAAALLMALGTATTALAAPAATAHDVLTISKVGGPNVKVHATLKANLKSKTATFTSPGGVVVSCKKSTFTDKVTSNPRRPGTAHESLTAQTFSSCSITGVTGATGIKSVTINKLPYKTTISDSKGFPVTVTSPRTTIVINSILGAVNCTFSASKITGKASNKGQTIAFSSQKFKLSSGSSLCPGTGSFSATYGPVRDFSVSKHPAVFVN